MLYWFLYKTFHSLLLSEEKQTLEGAKSFDVNIPTYCSLSEFIFISMIIS